MHPRLRNTMTWTFGAFALLLIGAVAMATVLGSIPHPGLVAAAVMTSAIALAWPFATADTQFAHLPVCRDCHGPAVGFGEFGFCIRCGSLRVHRHERSS